MWVFLADTGKNDRFACGVYHVDCSANLLIDCIKLGQDDSINRSRVRLVYCEVNQRLIEFCQLIYGIITHKSFTYKEYHIWSVNVD